ncbi:MAG: RagB/SusD family nutrient uptake outer membrane protein [Bacteroidetes bacterium]|nr:MAG: RagB/SusD family nutrient uptake outer membrane protein [Bacteroidota bacterium]
MKTRYAIRIALVLMILITACEDDFLDRRPLDTPIAEDYWSTPSELMYYVNQFYLRFRDGGQWSMGIQGFDLGTDDLVESVPSSFWNGEKVAQVSGAGWNYKWIRKINYFFENYSKCKAPFDEYKQYLGEAYFFRALLYFELVRSYGDVPWVDEVLDEDSPELYTPRTSRNVVVDSIIADLDRAAAYMISGNNQDRERLNRETALLYKSRVCLFEGTWEKYHEGTAFGVPGSDYEHFLEEAVSAAEEAMASGMFSIYKKDNNPETDYYSMFNSLDLSENTEVLLQKKWAKSFEFVHEHKSRIAQPAGIGMTRSIVNDYLCSDGKPITTSPLYRGDDNLDSLVLNRDPRLLQTMNTRGDVLERKNGEVIKSFDIPILESRGRKKKYHTKTGYMMKKGGLPDMELRVAGEDDSPSILFRYAELLLNFAEAKAELGTLTQSDVDQSINLLRDRVGMVPMDISSIDHDPNWLYPEVSALINEVRRERHIELSFEGFRKYDILRWRAHHLFAGKRPKGMRFVQEDYPDLVPGTDLFVDEDGLLDPMQHSLPSGYGFRPGQDYLLPIPLNQLELNPNLKQNPGWPDKE